MSDKYTTRKHEGLYFVTLTVVDWVDVFTRKEHKLTIIESLKYCQKKKGLIIHAYCLMSNHLHMIISAEINHNLSDILRDFKKFTSKKIVNEIQNKIESRKDWMLYRFEFAGKYQNRVKNYKFWQDGNMAKEIINYDFMIQKLEYIHNNPVKELIVKDPEIISLVLHQIMLVKKGFW